MVIIFHVCSFNQIFLLENGVNMWNKKKNFKLAAIYEKGLLFNTADV